MSKDRDKYIPALRFRWLTFLYDPLQRWVLREETFKGHLIAQSRIEAGHRVLDLGCGTGTLTIMAKRAHPLAEVVGLDGDVQVLQRAREKAAKAGASIALVWGMSFQLPHPESSFDRVLSSLLLHHLTVENKLRTLREGFRVLKPGGQLHVVDFGKARNPRAHLISLVMRHFEKTDDLIKGLLPGMLRQAGFEQVEETTHHMTVFGTLSVYGARKPEC